MVQGKKRGPSYRGLRPSSDYASRVGRSNRAKNTTPELILRRTLWHHGIRFRLHARQLPGCPDLILPRFGAVVFCDGDFWHGRNWKVRKRKLRAGSNPRYWVAKIAGNRMRDQATNRALSRLGWRVIRVWEKDVRRNPDRVVLQILKQLSRRRETCRLSKTG